MQSRSTFDNQLEIALLQVLLLSQRPHESCYLEFGESILALNYSFSK